MTGVTQDIADKQVDSQRIHAQDILEQADRVLTKRNRSYGTLEEDFKITAGLWSAFFGIEISPDEVTQAMVLLKIGRTKSGVFSEDNYIDQAGYSGISAALADTFKNAPLAPEDPDEYLTRSPPDLGRSKSFGQGVSMRGNVEGGTP